MLPDVRVAHFRGRQLVDVRRVVALQASLQKVAFPPRQSSREIAHQSIHFRFRMRCGCGSYASAEFLPFQSAAFPAEVQHDFITGQSDQEHDKTAITIGIKPSQQFAGVPDQREPDTGRDFVGQVVEMSESSQYEFDRFAQSRLAFAVELRPGILASRETGLHEQTVLNDILPNQSLRQAAHDSPAGRRLDVAVAIDAPRRAGSSSGFCFSSHGDGVLRCGIRRALAGKACMPAGPLPDSSEISRTARQGISGCWRGHGG